MRYILTLTFILLGLHFASAQIVHQYDSTYTESWNSATSAWQPTEKQVYYSRPDCQDYDSTLRYGWNSGISDWKLSYSYHSTFDVNGLNILYEGINRTTGNPFYKYIYSYSGGKMSEYVLQYWQAHLSAYRNDTRLVYHRIPSSGLVDTGYIQRWDTVANVWRPSQKYVYARNANSTPTNYTSYNYIGSSYINNTKIDYTLNAADKATLTLSYKWDTITSTWMNSSRQTNTYNAQNFNTTSLNETWNIGTSTWKNSYRYTYTPTVNNEIASSLTEIWVTASSTWRNSSRNFNWWGCVFSTGIDDRENNTDLLSVFPNPASNILTIDNKQYTFGNVTIVDLTGKSIRSIPLHEGQNQIDVNDIAPSTYFIHFIGTNGHVVKKFVKE